MRKYNFY